MEFRDKILELLEEALKEKPSLFLVDLTITETLKVTVTLDGDNGVNLQDCIDISRAIDNNFDREEQDYALEVASAGISTPLKMVRQYRKNIGRTLKVKTASETIEALLQKVSDESIVLSWTAREPKKIGKGKETVEYKREIPFTEIKEAIVTIIFN
ncbi:MAG: ribosome assembly cofactor RimP [Flavobacteriaceae bacterium]|nr:ribosome assembly cofactor RimP [Flavobacteriaceae bacterium]